MFGSRRGDSVDAIWDDRHIGQAELNHLLRTVTCRGFFILSLKFTDQHVSGESDAESVVGVSEGWLLSTIQTRFHLSLFVHDGCGLASLDVLASQGGVRMSSIRDANGVCSCGSFQPVGREVRNPALVSRLWNSSCQGEVGLS